MTARPIRLTQARPGDVLERTPAARGSYARIVRVLAVFTHGYPDGANVRVADYHAYGAPGDVYRMRADDPQDRAEWRRIEAAS